MKLHKQTKMLLSLEALKKRHEVITEKIPSKEFDLLISDLLRKTFTDYFEFDFGAESQYVFDNFETFEIEMYSSYCSIYLKVKVEYDIKRSELVDDIRFSVDELEAYNADGDKITLDAFQCEILESAVQTQNFQA